MSRDNLKKNIPKWEMDATQIFDSSNDIKNFTVKFHILDHVGEAKSTSGSPNYLESSYHKN